MFEIKGLRDICSVSGGTVCLTDFNNLPPGTICRRSYTEISDLQGNKVESHWTGEVYVNFRDNSFELGEDYRHERHIIRFCIVPGCPLVIG